MNPALPITEVNRLKPPQGQTKILVDGILDATGMQVNGVDVGSSGVPTGLVKAKAIGVQGWGSPYEVPVGDLDSFVLTDDGDTAIGYIRLPTIAAAVAHGGVFRALATRTPSTEGDSANMLAIYPHADDGGVRFHFGNGDTLYSLFSSAPGDTIALIPVQVDGTWGWYALTFAGFWADRD